MIQSLVIDYRFSAQKTKSPINSWACKTIALIILQLQAIITFKI